MLEHSDIATELSTYLRESLCCEASLSPDVDLIAAGAIDSLMIVDLVRYIEDRYGVRLGATEIVPRNFRTTRVLGTLITDRMTVSAMAGK